MESSEIRERIFSLGKDLVEELGLDPGVDTIARWMAHYVAEKMTLAENSAGDAKIHAEQQCFDAILKLWQHRSYYPRGQRPFENFEQVFQTLERLNPDNPKTYFYSTSSDDSNESTDNVQQWINAALVIDQAARVWLEHVFRQAALSATDEKTLTWLEKSASFPNTDDVSAITYMLDLAQHNNDEDAVQQAKQERIKSRIEILDAFIEFSQLLRTEFVGKLKEITSEGSKSLDSTIIDHPTDNSDETN